MKSRSQALTIDCGAWPVELRLSASTLFFRDKLTERFGPLLTDSHPEAVLDVTAVTTRMDGPPADVISLHGEGIFKFASRGYRLEYDVKNQRGRAVFRFSRPGSEMSLLNSVLEVFIGVGHVLRGTGLLVHAAAVETNGRGWVFPGRSGAGKTTLAKSFPGRSLLNDETILIRLSGDGVTLWNVPLSVPLRGDVPCVPLDGIVFLERHLSPVLNETPERPLSPAHTAGLLVSHALPLSLSFVPADRTAWFELVLSLGVSIARSRPGYHLRWHTRFPEAARAFITRCGES